MIACKSFLYGHTEQLQDANSAFLSTELVRFWNISDWTFKCLLSDKNLNLHICLERFRELILNYSTTYSSNCLEKTPKGCRSASSEVLKLIAARLPLGLNRSQFEIHGCLARHTVKFSKLVKMSNVELVLWTGPAACISRVASATEG